MFNSREANTSLLFYIDTVLLIRIIYLEDVIDKLNESFPLYKKDISLGVDNYKLDLISDLNKF